MNIETHILFTMIVVFSVYGLLLSSNRAYWSQDSKHGKAFEYFLLFAVSVV